MSSSQHGPSVPVHATVPLSATPPAKLSARCHLDPSSYVKGHHQLMVEDNVIIHPRTYLFTEVGPLTIREGTIITEKCIIGRRDKNEPNAPWAPKSAARGKQSSAIDSTTNTGSTTDETDTKSKDIDDVPEIIIGENVHLQASVVVQAPCTISDSAVLEPGVVIFPNCSIGQHSKICAGITLPPGTIIPDWTVVYGMNGCMRRRKADDGAETTRLELLRKERATAGSLLRSSARNLAGGAGSSGAAKSKRESMIRG